MRRHLDPPSRLPWAPGAQSWRIWCPTGGSVAFRHLLAGDSGSFVLLGGLQGPLCLHRNAVFKILKFLMETTYMFFSVNPSKPKLINSIVYQLWWFLMDQKLWLAVTMVLMNKTENKFIIICKGRGYGRQDLPKQEVQGGKQHRIYPWQWEGWEHWTKNTRGRSLRKLVGLASVC